jgi:hypothetical protein
MHGGRGFFEVGVELFVVDQRSHGSLTVVDLGGDRVRFAVAAVAF